MRRRELPPPPLMAPTPSKILPALAASMTMGWDDVAMRLGWNCDGLR